jgi:hypothetical protein
MQLNNVQSELQSVARKVRPVIESGDLDSQVLAAAISDLCNAVDHLVRQIEQAVQ